MLEAEGSLPGSEGGCCVPFIDACMGLESGRV
jgi:hypothetical protein